MRPRPALCPRRASITATTTTESSPSIISHAHADAGITVGPLRCVSSSRGRLSLLLLLSFFLSIPLRITTTETTCYWGFGVHRFGITGLACHTKRDMLFGGSREEEEERVGPSRDSPYCFALPPSPKSHKEKEKKK